MVNQAPVAPPNIVIENAKFVYRPNFEGREEAFNDAGNRYFNVELPAEIVESVQADGWNVKYTKPRKAATQEELDSFVPVPYLEVIVGFKYRPPEIVLLTDGRPTRVSEETVGMLDEVQYESFDVVLRGRPWEAAFGSGIKAYLQTFYGTLAMDDIRRKYANLD